VIINADNTVSFTPNADFNGEATINYIITDGVLTSDSTASVTVNAVNDAPVVSNDTATTNEDTSVTIDVLANDSDVDGDTLTVVSATAANGTVIINADNTLTYTANQDFNGTDTITYTVGDENVTDSVMNISFTGGLFDLYDPTGLKLSDDIAAGPDGGASDVTGTLSIDMATGSGTATFSSSQDLFGFPWAAHDVTVQMTGADTATFSMLFDWNGD